MGAYDEWVESLGLPVHKGYYIEDLRTAEVGWWQERGCNAAFVQLFDQTEVTESRITEIPPGKTTASLKFALDELYYVLDGNGLATVRRDGGREETFEWHERSLFLIPRQSTYQLTNARGDKPVRLFSRNALPLASRIYPDLGFFFNNPYLPGREDNLENFYSEAKVVETHGMGEVMLTDEGGQKKRKDYGTNINVWSGSFFPDMGVWDKLDPYRHRGAGGKTVYYKMSNSAHGGHMSVFPSRTYKNAHCHGGGVFFVIPAGEGYSIWWEEGGEKNFVPWHEGGCFCIPYFRPVFHQHFNVGSTPARYLTLGSGVDWQLLESEARRNKYQIAYPDEAPWIRETFEKELAKRGLTSLMPDEVYKDRDYQWKYAEDK
ncbi:MAG: hypothetical protein Q8O55_01085 [Dehalococcoidales bacterium]|nr:hypothetical protein [Dehalococcoidales bacterium]MDZ4230827.1 hypothetical protein [Dehalococcoidales bacterium]